MIGTELPIDDVGETGVPATRLRGGAGGGVIGCMLTEQSFELRFGEMRAGKLRVFVHCERLRTILSLMLAICGGLVDDSQCVLYESIYTICHLESIIYIVFNCSSKFSVTLLSYTMDFCRIYMLLISA